MHVVGGAALTHQEQTQHSQDPPPPDQQRDNARVSDSTNSDDSHLEEVQLDDNGNNGASQDVEETEEDTEGKEKENSEEFNFEDHQKKRTVEECRLVSPFIDTHTMDKSEPLENLQMFRVEDKGGRSQNDNENRNFENLSDTNIRKEDEATFVIDRQNLSDGVHALDDKVEQICTINNSGVIGHLCSDEDTNYRRVDGSIASVQSHENMGKNDAELVLNSKCKSHSRTLRASEWQECFSGNQLIVVNQGHDVVDSVLRQGHQERLHLKWHLQQQVNPRDWISLCSLKLNTYEPPGSDQIPAEIIQTGGETLQSEIHKVNNSVWSKEELPDELKDFISLPVYKKGDKSV